jgi:hypothetical protein
MNPYITMTIGGMLGIVLHTFKVIRDINKRNVNVNFRMVFLEYWKTDYLSLTVSILCFATMLFVASEFIDLNHVEISDPKQPLSERLMHFKIANFIKMSSVIAGYFSDSIVYGFLGVTEVKLKKQFSDAEKDQP